jgi:hypothetical protein
VPFAPETKLAENDPLFIAHVIIIDGQIVGGWKRTLKKDSVAIELNLITELTKAESQAVLVAIEQYGKFLGLPAKLTNVPSPRLH